MKIKTIWSVLLIFALLFSLAACSGSGKTADTSDPEPETVSHTLTASLPETVPEPETETAEETAEETEAPSEEELLVRQTAAVVGDQNISVPVYNFCYSDSVSYIYNLYSIYAVYGIQNPMKAGIPFSEQTSLDGNGTLEDYFIAFTNSRLEGMYNLYERAVSDGSFRLPESTQKSIDDAIASMKDEADSRGCGSVNDFLSEAYGKGCRISDYETFLTVSMTASEYQTYLYETFAPSAEELRAAYEKDPSAYDVVNYSCVTTTAESTQDEASGESIYTDEAKEAAKRAAEEKQANFPEDASSTHASKANLGEEKANWLFDSARKAGDTTVIADNEAGTSYTTLRFDSRDTNDYARVKAYVVRVNKDVDSDGAEEAFAALTGALRDGMTDETFEEVLSEQGYSSYVQAIGKNDYVPEVIDYLFDPARRTGDLEMIETDAACYLVRLVSVNETTYRDELVKHALLEEFITEILSANVIVVDETALQYANTDLTFSNSN